jgi:hypothetical protein
LGQGGPPSDKTLTVVGTTIELRIFVIADILRALFVVMMGFAGGGSKRGSVEKLIGALSELEFTNNQHFMPTSMDKDMAIFLSCQ